MFGGCKLEQRGDFVVARANDAIKHENNIKESPKSSHDKNQHVPEIRPSVKYPRLSKVEGYVEKGTGLGVIGTGLIMEAFALFVATRLKHSNKAFNGDGQLDPHMCVLMLNIFKNVNPKDFAAEAEMASSVSWHELWREWRKSHDDSKFKTHKIIRVCEFALAVAQTYYLKIQDSGDKALKEQAFTNVKQATFRLRAAQILTCIEVPAPRRERQIAALQKEMGISTGAER